MTFAGWAMVVYGVAMIGMGVHGFVGSGSPASLAGGGGAGALVLFFAGVSSKLIRPRNRVLVLLLAVVLLAGTAIRVFSLPIEI